MNAETNPAIKALHTKIATKEAEIEALADERMVYNDINKENTLYKQICNKQRTIDTYFKKIHEIRSAK